MASAQIPLTHLRTAATRAYHPANAPTPVGWPDLAIAGLFIFNLTVEQVNQMIVSACAFDLTSWSPW